MKIALIISLKDTAALNIKKHLIKDFILTEEIFRENNVYKLNEDVKLYTTPLDSVHSENIDDEINADLFIFCTRHRSESGIPSLSIHSPGNFAVAKYGGTDRELNSCPASFLKKGLRLLEENKMDGFDIIQECTHHGPYMRKPVMFIEIGSTEKEWERDDAGSVIAKVIIELVSSSVTECESADLIIRLTLKKYSLSQILLSDTSAQSTTWRILIER